MSRDPYDLLIRRIEELERRLTDEEHHSHTFPDRFEPIASGGAGLTDFGGFGRGSTQSMTNGGTTDIQLDAVSNDPAGQTCLALDGTNLEFLVQGIYLVTMEAVGPSMTANGEFLLHWGVVMGNASIGGDGAGDRRVTTSSNTTRPTPQATRFFAVDAGAVVTFKITQTSGANRNFTFFGNTMRLNDNDSLFRAVGIGSF